ncbi:MAG: protein kinase, partial [Candidatus Aminicenantes bacterium]|nr:protein kinase [Candidatus Aminicenantes bacterium]
MAIKCPRCDYDNPETQKYCGECGTQLSPSQGIPAEATKTLRSSVDELATGSAFAGRYQIIEELGKGGMGKVYKVFDIKIKEKIALKLIKPEVATDRETIERFSNELRLARKIAHRNVCRMFDLGEAKGEYFITMEYVPGEDLKSFIRRSKRLDTGTALGIARQVGEGLAEAHRLGIVHRDLKPSNIMIDKEGNARIMDFGIARATGTSGLTGMGVVIGTPEYMSPELVEGEEADQRSDIYSLGVVFYEMVTGRLPFEGDTSLSVALKHKTEMPPDPIQFNPQISTDFNRVILKCLEKERSRRYQTVTELLSDLALSKTEQATGFRTPAQADSRSGIRKAGEKSIAVLPFADLSPLKDQEYFCDGIAEEIINSLTKIKELRVVARTSAFSFKGTSADVREIGRRLNVGTVLEGSVRKAGDKLRINAQLINVADGYHIWSERYDRTLEDIFAIQDEVTEAIIDNLRLTLVARENEAVFKRSTADLEAHNLYLKGIHYLRMYASRGFDEAIVCFQQAVEQDPGYAAAYYGLSDAYVQVAFWGGLPPSEACAKAKAYAKKALALDETLGDAHGTLSYVHTIHDWNWQAAERESLEALRLSPSSAMCHLTRSWYLSNTERHEEAVAEAFEAQRLDPVSSFVNTFPGVALIMQRQFARAIEELETAKKMNPDFYLIRSFLGMAYYTNGDYEEAVKEHQKATEISGGAAWMAMNLELALSQVGKKNEADMLLE